MNHLVPEPSDVTTLLEHAAALGTGRTTSRALVEACLAAIADPAGEGALTFRLVDAVGSRAQADAIDAQRRAGRDPGRFAGIPLSVKDLFDVAGQVTAAGSLVFAAAPPASVTGPAVARMAAAGFVLIGRTNMTEFAFSGLGLNPHFGTPASPWDRLTRRIPGGSSSGAAVSVSDGMTAVALGTDTGGSCRIPASLCGIVGYKPTSRRVPTDGVLPLSSSLDSVGPLANSVACCAIADAIMAGADPLAPALRDLSVLNLAVPDTIVLDGLDPPTAAAFERALSRLADAGAHIHHVHLPALIRIGAATNRTSLAACEAYAWHRRHLAAAGAQYDPRVRRRIEGGAGASAADYLDALATRRAICAEMDAATVGYDALIMPTVPIVAPPIAILEADDAAYDRANAIILRNTALFNLLDRCAISIPCHRAGDPATGLMLVGSTMGDAALLAVAATVEAALAR